MFEYNNSLIKIIMGLFGLFRSEEEKFRHHVRACFDESVNNAIKRDKDLIKEPLFGGMMVQAAIGSMYQTLKNDPRLILYANKANFNPVDVIEEECQRALDRYLE